jgi:hypothetical protein
MDGKWQQARGGSLTSERQGLRFIGRCVHALLVAVWIGMLAACSTTLERVNDPARLKDFAFIQPGITTAREVEARLGPPFNVYEGGRISTYRLEKAAGKYRATSDREAWYRLVLVYRPDGVLERWSLVYAGL